jgi:3-vinyl bacteriochlorophyllide hydratase
MFAEDTLGRLLNTVDGCPWGASAGRAAPQQNPHARRYLYTDEERRRRDATPWTMVQGVLAPVQFLVFLMSYTIMITGAIWEREVFGRYLFAPAFYWEDMFSMLVLALHTAYLAALFSGAVQPRDQMLLALAGYTAYVVNATQFVMKLRAARLEAPAPRRSRETLA